MNVAAIMPCRGRAEQTVANVKRLLATAGYGDWHLYLTGVKNEVDAIWSGLDRNGTEAWRLGNAGVKIERLTYWQALDIVTNQTDHPFLVNLANDLLPGMHWLRRAVDAYRFQFGLNPIDGMIGFNGDSHTVEHSCHFLISRGLLDRYGGWPTWYKHNFGDTELCQRAIADRCYAKAPWAILYHDHPFFGGQDDAVYTEGRATAHQDERLFKERRRQGWPPIKNL